MWYAWLLTQLPAGVGAGTSSPTPGSGGISGESQSVSAYGSVLGNNTSAGAAIATIPSVSLPAGRYRVDVAHYILAAATPTLGDNVELRKGATPLVRLLHLPAAMNSQAYAFSPKVSVVADLDGLTALSVNFIANFGVSETQTHNVVLVATKK